MNLGCLVHKIGLVWCHSKSTVGIKVSKICPSDMAVQHQGPVSMGSMGASHPWIFENPVNTLIKLNILPP